MIVFVPHYHSSLFTVGKCASELLTVTLIRVSLICSVQNHPTCKKVWGSQSGTGEQKETGGKKAVCCVASLNVCATLDVFTKIWNLQVVAATAPSKTAPEAKSPQVQRYASAQSIENRKHTILVQNQIV